MSTHDVVASEAHVLDLATYAGSRGGERFTWNTVRLYHVDGDRIAVISQVSSALWLGRLAPSGWEVAGDGICYALPRGADGGIVYGTAEGVSWMGPDQLVMVSDKAKPDQDPLCRAKDQSIHLFEIPNVS